ncbi:MAG: GNAT family N-acetyltransferase [Bacteroidia bacterium]
MIPNYKYEDGLETARIITRKLTEKDIPLWIPFFENEECSEFIPDFGLKTSEARAVHWIGRQLGRYAENRFGHQLLIDKQSGEAVGQCGLLLQEIDGQQEVEVGYHLLRPHWNKGYASEAAALFRDYGFRNQLAASIVSIIALNNVNSQRVATKNGMTREKQSRWLDSDVFVYRINRSNWENIK